MSMSDADRQKISVTLSTIGACPYSRAKQMKHYVTNGLKFRTKDSEKNKKTQNSGVSVVTDGGVAYYDIVRNIFAISITIIILCTKLTTARIKHIPCFSFNNYKPILVPLVLYIKHL